MTDISERSARWPNAATALRSQYVLGAVTVPATASEYGYSIRQAQRADLLEISRIESASFPQPWPYGAFTAFVGEPGFLVAADHADRIVGYVVADVAYDQAKTRGHLKDIAVHPDHRRNGIGSRLLRRAIAVLEANGARSIRLEVRPSNESAIDLYRSLGFDAFRRIQGYYEDGEDALIMVRKSADQ